MNEDNEIQALNLEQAKGNHLLWIVALSPAKLFCIDYKILPTLILNKNLPIGNPILGFYLYQVCPCYPLPYIDLCQHANIPHLLV
jgi:hypothetical protein